MKAKYIFELVICMAFLMGITAAQDVIIVGDAEGCVGDQIEIVIDLENNSAPVQSLGMDIQFDTQMLEYVGCQPGILTGDWAVFECTLIDNQTVRVGAFDLFGDHIIPAGSTDSIVYLTFSVTCDLCQDGDNSLLTAFELTDDIEEFDVENGTFTFDCSVFPSPTETPTGSPTPDPTETATPEPTIPPVTPSPVPTSTPGPQEDTITVSNAEGCQGDQIHVEITIDNPITSVDVFGMDLNFDPDMMAYEYCTPGILIQDWPLFDCSLIEPGTVRLSGIDVMGDNVIQAGSSGILASVTFTVTCDLCQLNDTSDLIPNGFTDDLIDFVAINGLFTHPCEPLPTQTPTETPAPTETPIGTVTPTETPNPPTETPIPTPADDMIWPADAEGCNGDVIEIPVYVDNPDTAVSAFGFEFEFETAMLVYNDCVPGELISDWIFFDANLVSPGVVRIGGFDLDAIPVGSEGVLAILTFTVDCLACSQNDTSLLTLTNFEDDLALWNTDDGVFTYSCVPTPTPTETPVPTPTDDMIWPADAEGCNGDVIEIPVYVDNPDTAVSAFGFEFEFETAMLVYNDCVAGELISDWIFFDANLVSPGVVRIGGFDLDAIPVGSEGVLAILTFTVDCLACSQNDTSLLTLTNFEDDLVLWNTDDGVFTYSCVPTPTPTFTPIPDTPTPSPTDTPTPTFTPIPDTPTPTVTPTITPTQTSSDTIEPLDTSGCNDDMIAIEIVIDNPDTPLDAFGFDFVYNSGVLSYISCAPGELTQDWLFFDCNLLEPGELRVGGFDLEPIAPGSAGSVAVLNFLVDCGSCQEGDTYQVFLTNLVDDIAHWQTHPGTFTYSCPATPTPSPTDTPTSTPTFTPIPDTPTPTPTPIPDTPTPTPTPVPDTPTPTPTPIPDTPTPTPTPVPDTPTPTPTPVPDTPTPTPTPVPDTPTPTPEIRDLGVYLEMPKDYYVAGDICYVLLTVANDTSTSYFDVPLFVLLDIHGQFYLWPSWTDWDYALIDIPPIHEEDFQIVEPFIWPQVDFTISSVWFVAGVTNSDMNEIIGRYDMFEFGWGW
jgi:hypothetical protein